MRVKRAAIRSMRSVLLRYVRAEPREAELEGAERRVYVVLMTAFGMGGTIRTTLNLAEHLASRGYSVRILSVRQDRDEPFFGEMAPGVEIETLDDRRAGHEPSRLHPLRRWMRRQSSVLMHPEDRSFKGFNLFVDWRLVRALRGRAGFLVTTRPGLNLIAAQLAAPGLVLIGQEHMHLGEHSEVLQEAMRRRYRRLAALSVLTERDRKLYAKHLGRRTRVLRIPNTVRDMGGVSADLDAPVVLAAGRFARQKGFDRLIKTWSLVHPRHPDWRLRICGEGPALPRLERLVAEHGLGEVVTLAGPSTDLGAEMARASIFVLSSRWEGLPLVLLEAMGAGMGVVSFDCPTGPADVIDDHVNGLLIRPRKIARLADGLCEMIEDRDLRKRCAEGARSTAADYTMDAIGPRWEAVLEEAWREH